MQEMYDYFIKLGLLEPSNVKIEHRSTDVANYMERGERILTLAKKRKIRSPVLNNRQVYSLLDYNYPNLSFNNYEVFDQITYTIKKAITKQFKSVTTKESLQSIGIPFLYQHCGTLNNLHIEIVAENDEQTLVRAVTKSDLSLKLSLLDYWFFIPINPKRRFSDNRSYFFKCNPKYSLSFLHIESAFYIIFLLDFINRAFGCGGEEEIWLDKTLECIISNYFKNILSYNWILLPEESWFKNHLTMNGFICDRDTSTFYRRANRNTQDFQKAYFSGSSLGNSLQVLRNLLLKRPVSQAKLLLDKGTSQYFSLPYPLEQCALSLVSSALKDRWDIEAESNHRRVLDAEVARAYTTKKNIPISILNAMEDSGFNEYFGFVEFDEEVDLILIKLIEMEFRNVNQNIFHGFICPTIALRFRKLGRHHASGLYYPSIGTMVVDFRHPSSFIHEYFHMLDDLHSNPSLETSFGDIAERYRFLLMKKKTVDGDSSPLNRKGKYGIHYYLRKAEIYARCGEIYVSRILKVESSLLKPNDEISFAYPADGVLDELITKYFKKFLKELSEKRAVK